MIPTNLKLNFLTLCISIVIWQMVTQSVLSQSPSPSLPLQCARNELNAPVRCGCFNYEKELQDPKWTLLRRECNNTLNGNLDNGRRFCRNFIEGGKLQQEELRSYFKDTFSTCAVPAYNLDYPYPSTPPSVRFKELSQGETATNFEYYFKGYAGAPSYPMIRVNQPIYQLVERRLKQFCYVVVYFRARNPERAKRICTRNRRHR